MNLLCLGMGYSARALARRLAIDGWSIAGTSTSVHGARAIDAQGWRGIVFDGQSGSLALADAIRSATHIVISIPPRAGDDPILQWHARDLAAAPALTWIAYLSTIGVYGNWDGTWVDETFPLKPNSERSRHRVVAENQWTAFGTASGKRVGVFRLAGIYGPGRSAIDNLRAGTARRIVKPGQVFNRIHVDDIATTLISDMAAKTDETVFNVTDDAPAPPQGVIAFAAGLLGMPAPAEVPFEDADLSPMGRSFYGENKRVRNTRIKDVLGVRLGYPTYREGLAAIIRGG